jgi:hypothetical protein
MNKSITNRQINKALQVLADLSVNVTTDDKSAASEELGIHKITISRYLKGDGSNLDLATKMIQFFKKRISEREKAIRA